eukprot:Gregarina_sp_Poly_1__2321@NODE_161_length_12274_cov_73_089211_g143_i0_p8_GENE_NODE_161_length_12274_cov_73_089211_g143_i0NODE_161_length_12274_cov_73_089211_g143_i0_p8_ORF_typecomplete_len227_score30_99DUF2012/PF09430_10/2_4e12CarbopepD_reg_2/PF13715_6/0_0012CarboxypepD_reg/PF13620_6/0_0045_NODE_161_length_12274_cov_73_089211_g143_i055916271
MRFIGALVGCLGFLASANAQSQPFPLRGRVLKVPKDAYESGIPPKSWWLSHTDEFSDQWKQQKLDLRNTGLYLHKLIPGQPLGEGLKIEVDSSGDFELPTLEKGEYLLEVEHIAYKFQPVLISVDQETSIFKVEWHTGVRHISGYLPTLTLRPERFDSPYPTPEGFNVFKYLKNPMVIMLLVTGFLGVVMPRLMDADAMAELRQEQAGDGPNFNSAFFARVKTLVA